MVMNLTICLPNGLKKIAFILIRRGESRSELQQNHLNGCLSKSRKPRNYQVRQKKCAESPENSEAENWQISKCSKFKPLRPKCRQYPNFQEHGSEKSKHPFWDNIYWISFFLNFRTQGGPPIGPLFGQRAFFLQTPVGSSSVWGKSDLVSSLTSSCFKAFKTR